MFKSISQASPFDRLKKLKKHDFSLNRIKTKIKSYQRFWNNQIEQRQSI